MMGSFHSRINPCLVKAFFVTAEGSPAISKHSELEKCYLRCTKEKENLCLRIIRSFRHVLPTCKGETYHCFE